MTLKEWDGEGMSVFPEPSKGEVFDQMVEADPKGGFTVRALVAFDRKFESKEAFERFLVEDLTQMGFYDENGNYTEDDKKLWKELYRDVPFPPTTVEHFLAYVKQDIKEDRYSIEELFFDESDPEDYKWEVVPE